MLGSDTAYTMAGRVGRSRDSSDLTDARVSRPGQDGARPIVALARGWHDR